jgi:hypothetical protein
VSSSTAVTDSIAAACAAWRPLSALKCSTFATTASASNGAPSENVTSVRRSMLMVVLVSSV